MKSALIGYNGFVGSNLITQYQFDDLYNSKNIDQIQNKSYDLIVCCGVSAVKWLANQQPETDKKNITALQDYLGGVKANKFILISTIDIYHNPIMVDESSIPDINKQDFYGKHRYELENWVAAQFENHYILRLPGLFGKNLKKNLIFDILNPIPKTLNAQIWQNLQTKLNLEEIKLLNTYYKFDANKNSYSLDETLELRPIIKMFKRINFSSLIFTDSRNNYQFYNLDYLFKDVQLAIDNKYNILNLATAPINAQALVKFLTGKTFDNHIIGKLPINYNMYSKYAKDQQYIYSKDSILEDINKFYKQFNQLEQ